MKTDECRHEPAVRQAATGEDRLEGELAMHAAACPVCAESVRVGAFLRAAARAPSAHGLPDVRAIWWRYEVVRQLRQDEEREHRAARPLVWGQAVSVGLAALLAALLLASAAYLLSAQTAAPIGLLLAGAPLLGAVTRVTVF